MEQYGRRNNLEITGIPDDVSDENLEEKVIQVLSEIQVNVSSSDIEACHRIGKSKNSSKKKKKIVRLINRKHAKKALFNRKFVSYFCTKANLFNDFFGFNMYTINNGSTMPPFALPS